jgi:hypothetical protein
VPFMPGLQPPSWADDLAHQSLCEKTAFFIAELVC